MKTKEEVHQPSKAQKLAAKKGHQGEEPKPNGADATTAFSAIAMGALAVLYI